MLCMIRGPIFSSYSTNAVFRKRTDVHATRGNLNALFVFGELANTYVYSLTDKLSSVKIL
jgi:hypothetical protein